MLQSLYDIPYTSNKELSGQDVILNTNYHTTFV